MLTSSQSFLVIESVNKHMHFLLKVTQSPEPFIHILDNLKILHYTISNVHQL